MTENNNNNSEYPTICLYVENVTDVSKMLKLAEKGSYNRIILSLCNRMFGERSFNRGEHKRFTRSDLLLTSSEWRNRAIFRTSDVIQCDSNNQDVRLQNETQLKQEIDFAKHLNYTANILVPLEMESNVNMANMLLKSIGDSNIIAQLSIVDKECLRQYRKKKTIDATDSLNAATKVWKRWNEFRMIADFNIKFKVKFYVLFVK